MKCYNSVWSPELNFIRFRPELRIPLRTQQQLRLRQAFNLFEYESMVGGDALGAIHKWRQHFLGSLSPLGAYVSLSSAIGMPLGASNWWRHLWTAQNQKQSFSESSLFPSELTESVLQKGSSWYPLRPDLDGFSWIIGFFIIHHLFWWPLVPPSQLLSAF